MDAATTITLAVNSLPSLITAGKALLKKLDDDDPNTGLIMEVVKGFNKSLKQGLSDIKNIGGEASDKVKETIDSAKEVIASAEEVAAKIDRHIGGGNDKH